MASAPDARQLGLAYGRQLAAIRQRVTASVTGAWDRLDSWRTPDINRFARTAAPAVEAGMTTTASLTDAYLARFEAAVTDRNVRPVGVRPTVVSSTAIRGTPTVEVYQRAGPVVWSALARRYKLDIAVRMARSRVEVLVATDLQLAKTHASRAVLAAKDNVSGFRRVTHGTCDLCRATAHEQYAVDELMPIHPGCTCDIEPVYDGHRPITITTPERPVDITDTKTVAHGELGPLLMAAAWTFTKLGDTEPLQPVTGADAFDFGDEDEEDDA